MIVFGKNTSFDVKAPKEAAALFNELMTAQKESCDRLGFSFYRDPNMAYQHPIITAALDRAIKSHPGDVSGQIIIVNDDLIFRITRHSITSKAA